LGASIIYTVDRRHVRVKHLSIVIPICRETLQKYHRWVKKKLGNTALFREKKYIASLFESLDIMVFYF